MFNLIPTHLTYSNPSKPGEKFIWIQSLFGFKVYLDSKFIWIESLFGLQFCLDSKFIWIEILFGFKVYLD